jgi:hypothetical protein
MRRVSLTSGVGEPGTIYLVHLHRPYAHARHYLGWAADVERRLAEHRAGRGSPLLRAAAAAGIDFQVVRTWPGTRFEERRLHRFKNTPARLCPICRGEASSGPAPGYGVRVAA